MHTSHEHEAVRDKINMVNIINPKIQKKQTKKKAVKKVGLKFRHQA